MTPEVNQLSAVEPVEVGRLSDLDLVTAVIARDEEAFAELFRRHSPSVAAAARMILGNQPECEDVVAEVFVGFWLAPEKFRPDRGSLLTFLRITVKSRSIDLVRSNTARVRREAVDGLSPEPSPGSDESLLAAETTRQLHHALAELPRHEREPVELAYFHGLTYSDVAARLGIPEGTVKSRIRSAMKKLRQHDHIEPPSGARSTNAGG
jgi:RNA polymerase sigma-70 factor (ECF subfamily)